ncbi:TPA: DUF190 domain-containing protein [Pseudomonas aeruginosa]
MNGYQITFFTQQDRLIGKSPAGQWLIEEARRLGLRGATLSGAVEGLGHDGVIHAINLFDLSDQPVQVTVVVTEAEAEFFLEHLTGVVSRKPRNFRQPINMACLALGR